MLIGLLDFMSQLTEYSRFTHSFHTQKSVHGRRKKIAFFSHPQFSRENRTQQIK